MQNFIDPGYTKVKHFRNPFPYKWKPAAEVAVATGIRSIRDIGRIFSVILRFFKQSGLKWTPHLRSNTPFQHFYFTFKVLSLLTQWKNVLYIFCVLKPSPTTHPIYLNPISPFLCFITEEMELCFWSKQLSSIFQIYFSTILVQKKKSLIFHLTN